MRKLFIILFFLSVASPAYAVTTHTYVCNDLTMGADSSCVGAGSSLSLTIPNTNMSSAFDSGGAHLNVNGASWKVTFVVAGGASGTGNATCSDSCSGGFTFTTSVTDQTASFTGSGGAGIDITNNSNSFNGTLTYLCISDTAGQCIPPVTNVFQPIIDLVQGFWIW